MINIGITGSNGLIGYHLRVFLENKEDVKVFLADRETFSSSESLEAFAKDLNVLVHLADKNVGADKDLREINMDISRALTDACEKSGNNMHLIFASSTHTVINPKAAYSISKVECSEYLQNWCNNHGFDFSNLIIPHVFGEFGKPFYNSVVSSFCYQLAHNETTKIIEDKELELLHAHDVAEGIFEIIQNKRYGQQKLSGSPMSVVNLRQKLIDLSELYLNNIVPALESKLDYQLFNTYRSYLPKDYYPREYELNIDDRGILFESIKAEQSGLTFASTTKPGVTRGNHYHIDKFERFIVLDGNAT
ncbi:uncharacterized protein METZ01_LOCUS255255, partial [marine metagenome]